jgi:hypothetical protein
MTMVMVILFIGLLFILHQTVLPIFLPLAFTSYLIYGFVRLKLPKARLQAIEEDEDLEI